MEKRPVEESGKKKKEKKKKDTDQQVHTTQSYYTPNHFSGLNPQEPQIRLTL